MYVTLSATKLYRYVDIIIYNKCTFITCVYKVNDNIKSINRSLKGPEDRFLMRSNNNMNKTANSLNSFDD